jgi:hypothetical protein
VVQKELPFELVYYLVFFGGKLEDLVKVTSNFVMIGTQKI